MQLNGGVKCRQHMYENNGNQLYKINGSEMAYQCVMAAGLSSVWKISMAVWQYQCLANEVMAM